MADEKAGEQTDQEPSTGRHAAPDAGATGTSDASDAGTAESGSTATGSTGSGASAEATSEETVTSATPTEHVASPDAAPTEHVASPDAAPTEHVATPAAAPTRRIDRPQGPPPQAPAPSRSGGDGARRAVRRVTGVLATLLRIVGLLLAAVLVAFVVLTLVGVNPDNGVAQLVVQGADVLVMRFRDLFLPADPRLALVVDYGLAALFWLVIGLLAARVVRALGRLV